MKYTHKLTLLRSVLLVSAIAMPLQYAVSAEALSMSETETVTTLLVTRKGTAVTLKLSSGQEISGKVKAVNKNLVHIANISGKEYFDGFIPLSKIEAVEIRNR
ncbi:MAG: hypothetical protein H6999_06905 [Hahellaceae bacterium]|nr:hypothetical protein [Hahellaceae bacterium]